MTGSGDDTGRRIAIGLAGAILLHGVFVAALIAAPESSPIPSRPTTRVHMVAAQAGAPSVGVVTTPTEPTPPTPAPRAADRPELSTKAAPKTAKLPPRSQAKMATVTPNATKSKQAPPVAGAGPVGDKGADLANVDLGGTDFPAPGYVRNIVNRIAEQFHPPQGSTVRAEVLFVIRRDGSVDLDGMQMLTRSGNYSFDNAAMAAIEAVANKKLFGPLPAAYPNDALTVIFKFDPSIIRP